MRQICCEIFQLKIFRWKTKTGGNGKIIAYTRKLNIARPRDGSDHRDWHRSTGSVSILARPLFLVGRIAVLTMQTANVTELCDAVQSLLRRKRSVYTGTWHTRPITMYTYQAARSFCDRRTVRHSSIILGSPPLEPFQKHTGFDRKFVGKPRLLSTLVESRRFPISVDV